MLPKIFECLIGFLQKHNTFLFFILLPFLTILFNILRIPPHAASGLYCLLILLSVIRSGLKTGMILASLLVAYYIGYACHIHVMGPGFRILLAGFANVLIFCGLALYGGAKHIGYNLQLKQLKQSERRFRRIFEDAPLGIGLCDSRGCPLHFNRRFPEWFGNGEPEPPENFNLFTSIVFPAAAQEKLLAGESIRFSPRRGSYEIATERRSPASGPGAAPLDLSVTPLRSPDTPEKDVISGYLVLVRDILAAADNGAGLEDLAAKDKPPAPAVEYEQLKTKFFSNLSHELKTPLNVILSTIQLSELHARNAGQKDSGGKAGKYLSIMKQNCYRLLRLVNNLIDLTKIDAGYLHLHFHNCNIVNVVEEITLSVSDYMESKGISLEFDTDTEERILACDPDQIERVVLNLLSNALKYTESGGEIQVKVTEQGENILISVKDTGIGIPADKQGLIFERFGQVDTSLTRSHEGSGIGLSLAKALVELHHGKISVESLCGKGSTFTVELPAALPENVEPARAVDFISQADIERARIEFSDIYELQPEQ